MSGPSDPAIGSQVLADPAALRAGDRFDVLPALATGGAQVRAVAEQFMGARFERPRSLIVVDAASTGDAAMLAALLPHPRTPILASAVLPAFAGPLDLAVVLARSSEDRSAVAAAVAASRQGVALIVRGAEHGAVADAAGGAITAPRIAVPELAAGPGRLALLLAVAHAADIAPGDAAAFDLQTIADAMDAEALACGPGAEPFVNPAIALAQRIGDGPALFIAADPIGIALAERCARAVRVLGGQVAAAHHAADLLPGGQLAAGLGPGPDIYADDEFGPVGSGRPVPVLIPALRASDGGALMATLTRSLLRAAELVDEQAASPASRVAVLGLRVDVAAAYLGIAARQIPPSDGPDGLGPAGRAPRATPAATVDDVTNQIRDERDGHRWN